MTRPDLCLHIGGAHGTEPWRVPDPQSRALAACVGFDHHLPSAGPCREQGVPLAPYLFNTNKEKKMSSLNTFAASGGTQRNASCHRGGLMSVATQLLLNIGCH